MREGCVRFFPFLQSVGYGITRMPCRTEKTPLQSRAIFLWELSSAGSERLPYKQRVGGSNPSAPTRLQPSRKMVFLCREHSSVGLERLLDKQEVSGSNPLVPTTRGGEQAGEAKKNWGGKRSSPRKRFDRSGLQQDASRFSFIAGGECVVDR